MIAGLTVLVMLIVAYSHFREGLFTAACHLVNVLLAGVIAFNFWPPIATTLEDTFSGTALAGYEDAFVMSALFAASLAILRALTNHLANREMEYHPAARIGGAVLGLITGYFVAG